MYLIYYRSTLNCVLFILFTEGGCIMGKQLKIYNYYKTNDPNNITCLKEVYFIIL